MDDTLGIDVEVALDGFELSVAFDAPVGVTVLLGPSGAGKSTTLDAVAGLVPPRRGSIRLGARVLFESQRRIDVPPRHRNVGYVPQSLALFPHLTVLDNVTFALRDERVGRAKGEALLERMGVGSFGLRRPDSLSGGERQRVALARALARDPSLLLLDEPFAALDRVRRRNLIVLLRELVSERRVPALVVTHDAEEAEALGDHVVVLDAGRVVAHGAPLEVLDAPAHWAAIQLHHAENRIDATVTSVQGESGLTRLRCGDVSVVARFADVPQGARVHVAFRAVDVIVAMDPPGRLSASNVLPGTVKAIETVGRVARVTLECGISVIAEITPSACERLGLVVGANAWAIVKARACHVLDSAQRNENKTS